MAGPSGKAGSVPRKLTSTGRPGARLPSQLARLSDTETETETNHRHGHTHVTDKANLKRDSVMKGGGFGRSGSERCGNAASRGLATVPVTIESELAELMGRRLRRRGLIVIFFSMYPRAAGRGPRLS